MIDECKDDGFMVHHVRFVMDRSCEKCGLVYLSSIERTIGHDINLETLKEYTNKKCMCGGKICSLEEYQKEFQKELRQ